MFAELRNRSGSSSVATCVEHAADLRRSGNCFDCCQMYVACLDCAFGILTTLVDTSEVCKIKVRMYFNFVFVADSADRVKRQTQKVVARCVRSIPGLISIPRSCN